MEQDNKDTDILRYALAQLEKDRDALMEKITYLRAELARNPDGGGLAVVPMPGRQKRKRAMSAAARKRISTAQKQRWAEWKRNKKASAR